MSATAHVRVSVRPKVEAELHGFNDGGVFLLAWAKRGPSVANTAVYPSYNDDASGRRLSLVVLVPKDETPTEQAKPTIQLRQEQANGISETRAVVAGGRIIASQGFVVASDQRSALLDPAKLRELVQTGPDQVELFLEWELASN